MRFLVSTGVCVLLLFATATPRAEAQDTPRLQWHDGWGRFNGVQGAVAGAALLGAFVVRFADPPDRPRWREPVLFDAPLRDAFRLENEGPRRRVARASDVLLVSSAAVTLVDSLLVALAIERAGPVAAQMMAMNTLAYSVTTLTVALTKVVFARQRPFANERNCDTASAEPGGCDSGSRNLSFISGHSAMAFTGAGLTCVQHRHLPLYGHRALDGGACGLALVSATLTAVFRMMVDKHWSSDVILGAAVGLASGWLMPRYVYFRGGNRRVTRGTPVPMVGRSRVGLAYAGIF